MKVNLTNTLKDVAGGSLRFLKTRNTDGTRYATRSGTRNALLNSLRGNVGDEYAATLQPNQVAVKAVRRERHGYLDHSYLDLYYNVVVTMSRGLISIGCHIFGRAASQKILRWLGITPTQFAVARKVGRAVARKANV